MLSAGFILVSVPATLRARVFLHPPQVDAQQCRQNEHDQHPVQSTSAMNTLATVLLACSDFNARDAEGRLCKAICARMVTVAQR